VDPRREARDTFVLGLTGPIACGKTTAGDILLELGAGERIDADIVTHELMLAGTETSEAIRERFGDDVMQPDGNVNRGHLASVVFEDHAALETLEAIAHPAVCRVIRNRLASLAGQGGVVVVDAVKLLQSELVTLCREVWIIDCNAETQMRRLMENRGMAVEDAKARLEAQPSFEHDVVSRTIDNSGTIYDLRRGLEHAWQELSV